MSEPLVAPDAGVCFSVGHIVMPAKDGLDEDELRMLKALPWNPARVTAEFLPGRGSARSFTRLRSGRRRVMLIRHDPERTENEYYADHARLLARAGLSVPQVIHERKDLHLTLWEDVGDVSLGDLVQQNKAAVIVRAYRKVLDQTLRLHRYGTQAVKQNRTRLMPAFNGRLYRIEHRLFLDHFLPGRSRISPSTLEEEFNALSRKLSREERVLVHRDLQSSNVFFRKGEPVLIDFQGMRMGPAVYDHLASLLCDPYVSLSLAMQRELLDAYAAKCEHPRRIHDLFWWAAVQRLLQALGAYGRLCVLPGCASFADPIPPALRMLQRALDRVDGLPKLSKLCRQLK